MPFRPNLNIQSDLTTGAIFEDATLYEMDNKLIGAPLPPHASQETDVNSAFHYTGWKLTISGLFGVNNCVGTTLLPNQLLPLAEHL